MLILSRFSIRCHGVIPLRNRLSNSKLRSFGHNVCLIFSTSPSVVVKATLRNPFDGSPSSHGSSISVGYPLIGSF